MNNNNMAEPKNYTNLEMRWSLEGKTALVTGGSRGIGSSSNFVAYDMLYSFFQLGERKIGLESCRFGLKISISELHVVGLQSEVRGVGCTAMVVLFDFPSRLMNNNNMAEPKNYTNLEMRWSLEGKTALVTGGSRGIGHAIVEELAKFGAIVHTCCRKESELEKCLEEWKKKGFKVTGSVCDVSQGDQREKLMEDVSSIFQGKLNILVNQNQVRKATKWCGNHLADICHLCAQESGTGASRFSYSSCSVLSSYSLGSTGVAVNNAGVLIQKKSIEFNAEDMSTLLETNFVSGFHFSQLSHPLLKASGNGSIVFISSIAGAMALSDCAIYGATKGTHIQLNIY
ncbi:hypothetical protein F8388_024961 [Cannabis sativa]|uniref:Uncharacterized protein n=1 Tax=Cannabis sativa TaxID=3483 RepID=A0A7J6G5U9_CANSA|nr:hypothetical protein F8388_024961 [Cannabis sativa]